MRKGILSEDVDNMEHEEGEVNQTEQPIVNNFDQPHSGLVPPSQARVSSNNGDIFSPMAKVDRVSSSIARVITHNKAQNLAWEDEDSRNET